MKKHYLSKGEGETLLGAKDDGYSVYKNPNAELREEIKNFKPDQTKVTMGWPEKTWDIIDWEDKEVKCQNGRNTSYFPINEVKEALKDNEELQRNLKFPAYEYFKQSFGIVSSVEDWGDGKKVSILDLQSHIRMGNYNPTSVEHYNFEYEGELSSYNELAIELSKGCTSMAIYFNENGDYMNRDYNLNLNNYECKEENLGLILEALRDKILALGEVMYAKGNYYAGDKKFTLFTEREDHELRNEFKIGYFISKVKAAPKKMEVRPASAMWEDVLSNIPEDVYDIYRIKIAVEA
jgi:hypothetical protein